ncbi:rh99 [macacine betaherpesvirus 3]|uniref:Rh99 n=1 Tax=Rhesus cytomegalovirus (strain 68-1) TaxID=47929 RepID=Q2FAL7_RHCM6|nr:rh99 [macacine betaherpesvirus 3]
MQALGRVPLQVVHWRGGRAGLRGVVSSYLAALQSLALLFLFLNHSAQLTQLVLVHAIKLLIDERQHVSVAARGRRHGHRLLAAVTVFLMMMLPNVSAPGVTGGGMLAVVGVVVMMVSHHHRGLRSASRVWAGRWGFGRVAHRRRVLLRLMMVRRARRLVPGSLDRGRVLAFVVQAEAPCPLSTAFSVAELRERGPTAVSLVQIHVLPGMTGNVVSARGFRHGVYMRRSRGPVTCAFGVCGYWSFVGGLSFTEMCTFFAFE